jgi:hypothetical protein
VDEERRRDVSTEITKEIVVEVGGHRLTRKAGSKIAQLHFEWLAPKDFDNAIAALTEMRDAIKANP